MVNWINITDNRCVTPQRDKNTKRLFRFRMKILLRNKKMKHQKRFNNKLGLFESIHVIFRRVCIVLFINDVSHREIKSSCSSHGSL